MKTIITLFFIILCAVFFYHAASPRTFDLATSSQWRPQQKTVHANSSQQPPTSSFYTLHADSHNSDELAIAAARDLELAWTAETDMFIGEGPTEDRHGNLYFSPIDPIDNVILVSLDGNSGKRRWAIKSDTEVPSHGGGAPLVLDDPQQPDQQIIYLSTYEKAVAVRSDGSLLWSLDPGLPAYQVSPGQRDDRHVYGLNYHEPLNALVGVTANGYIFVLDRDTGKSLLKTPYQLPGSPAKSVVSGRPNTSVSAQADELLAQQFGPSANGEGRFSSVLDALYGEGAEVSNFFAVDKFSGRIFIAASAPDAIDGTSDQRSEYGSLYALQLTRSKDTEFTVEVVARQDFLGGSGASPALSADGLRVYTADNDNHLLAFDRDLNPIWKIDVGQTIAASITVASENHELYAVSMQKIFKLIDQGDRATLVWEAQLDAFPELGPYRNINITTPTVTANGIAVTIGSGFAREGFTLPLNIGVGLLDRHSGRTLSYTPAREESVSVTMVSRNGGYYLANSPIRRAVTQSFGSWVGPPLTGGISYYKPSNLENLKAEAACAATLRVQAAHDNQDPLQKIAFVNHAMALLNQMERLGSDRNLSLKDLAQYCETNSGNKARKVRL